MKKYFFLFAAVLFIGAGCSSAPEGEIPADDPGARMDSEPAEVMVVDESTSVEAKVDIVEEEVQVFEVGGTNFAFSMEEIRVKEGDRVKIVFTSEEGFHDWVVDEFDAATEQITAGNTSEVEFVASKKGTFEYYCSVGSHRDMGMVGNLIIE